MGLKIRLSRAGAKKRPYYHIVVADSRSPRDGRFLEKVGSYNPMLPAEHQDRVRLQNERIQHWMDEGALPTERVARFLGHAGLAPMPAFREQPIQSAPKKKAQERAKSRRCGLALPGKRILMGVVGRPHGVRGLVRVHSYAEADLSTYSPLLDEQGRAWSLAWRGDGIAELRDASGAALVDRNAAERMGHAKLYVERDRLPEAAKDDFYLSDLVGLAVRTRDGAMLGRVVQVHDYGAGASLEIVGDGPVLLVPFTHAAVPMVDIAAGTLTAVLPTEVQLPLPLAGLSREADQGWGEGGNVIPDPGRERTTQPSSASGRGLHDGAGS